MRAPASRISLHQILVARAVEHDDGDVFGRAPLAFATALMFAATGASRST